MTDLAAPPSSPRGGDRTTALSTVSMLGLVAVAAVVAVAGFRAVFVDWGFLRGAIPGAVGAVGIAGIAWWRRLLIGESVALSLFAFVVGGAVLVGPLPGPDALATLFDGLRGGWADLLSTSPPTRLTDELLVLPYALAWFAGLVGGELARRTSAPGLPIVGPLVAFGVTVLVTAEDRTVATIQGAVLAVVALALGTVQWTRVTHDADVSDLDEAHSSSQVRSRNTMIARSLVALTVVAVAAPWLGPRLPLADAEERFDLRDRTDPPWDPLTVPSPLVETKAFLRSDRADERLFTIESNERPERLTMAVLGDFDGAVWTVGSTTGSSAVQEFRAVGDRLPELDGQGGGGDDAGSNGSEVDATIVIDELRGAFVPLPGQAIELVRSDATGRRAENEVRMNLRTGTIAVPDGVDAGDRIEILATAQPEPSDDELRTQKFGNPLPIGDTDIVPLPVRNLAAELVEGIDVGWEQVEAIRNRFVEDGFYDTSPTARPGHSYFRLQEFLEDPDRLVGYEEQYAASAALLGRIADIPTRVVVGFLVPSERYRDGLAEVFAPDISAWIEVEVGGVGWVPVDVSPDRSREPSADAAGATIEEVAVPAPPPPPPVPPTPEVLPSVEDDEEQDEEVDDEEQDENASATSGASPLALVAAGATSVALLLLLCAVVVAIVKARRRRARRRADVPAARVAGAWHEVLDRTADAGVRLDPTATPTEVARAMPDELVSVDGRASLVAMAQTVQRSAYHAEPPEFTDADAAWTYHDRLVQDVEHSMSWPRRILARCDPRTLRTHSSRSTR